MGLFEKLFGTRSQRELKKIQPTVDKILALEEPYRQLSEEEGYGFCLAAKEGDLRPMCKAMTAALHGRGGGKPAFQQGRVLAKKEEIEAFFASVG